MSRNTEEEEGKKSAARKSKDRSEELTVVVVVAEHSPEKAECSLTAEERHCCDSAVKSKVEREKERRRSRPEVRQAL